MKTVHTLCSLILIIGTTTLGCGNATAGADGEPRQRLVRFGDLNLNHEEGVKALYRRLTTAARAVCEPGFSVPQTLRSKARDCAQESIRDAVAQVNNAKLTAYYNAKNGPAPEAKVASRR